MSETTNIENILFIDIETIPICSNYSLLTEGQKKLWDKKAENLKKNEKDKPESLYNRAGIYAEFGKIICISVGIIKTIDNKLTLRIKSFAGDDEYVVLTGFVELVNKFFSKKDRLLCAHNGKEFDFPYIGRRCLINGIKLPSPLNLSGKKPWEINHLDTMEMWKFGDYKNYTSLELLAHVFNLPTPKIDIDGSEVANVYYKDKDLPRIIAYCQRDVATVARIYLKFQAKGEILEEDISIITKKQF